MTIADYTDNGEGQDDLVEKDQTTLSALVKDNWLCRILTLTTRSIEVIVIVQMSHCFGRASEEHWQRPGNVRPEQAEITLNELIQSSRATGTIGIYERRIQAFDEWCLACGCQGTGSIDIDMPHISPILQIRGHREVKWTVQKSALKRLFRVKNGYCS